MKKYTRKWFINFFSRIPTKKWCIGKDNDGHGRYCAIGHLHKKGHLGDSHIKFNTLTNAFLVKVNDDKGQFFYKGRSAKERVLNVLRGVK